MLISNIHMVKHQRKTSTSSPWKQLQNYKSSTKITTTFRWSIDLRRKWEKDKHNYKQFRRTNLIPLDSVFILKAFAFSVRESFYFAFLVTEYKGRKTTLGESGTAYY